jgi:hypothetical protein
VTLLPELVRAVAVASLREPDIQAFQRLGIPTDLIEEAAIQRVTDREARDKFGIVGSGDMSGVVFPYLDPATGHRVTARLRRDNPEVENGKPKNKYMSAYGDRRHLYFAPGAADLLADPEVPVVLVEAEKSVLALTAWARRTGTKYAPVGMGGCFGWRGRVGKSETANGERVDELGALPDLMYASKGRKTIVLMDANASNNPKVQKARKMLVRQLIEQGADAWIAELPSVDGVNGPDDYIGVCGDAAMAAVLATATRRNAGGDSGSTESQTARLLRLAAGVQLFHSQEHKPYATVMVNGHQEHMPIEGTKFRQWLREQYYRETQAAPRSQAIQDALSTLASRALFAGPECHVWMRVAGVADRVYLDLGNEAWQVVEITPRGWNVLVESPVKFRRPEGMLPLPTPERGGSLESLKGFVNLADESDWRLVVAFLLQCFRPQGPYPVLICNGEHGSAKSTSAKVLRDLVDPNAATHSSPPADVQDVAIAAHNQWLVSLDNLSRIPEWLSDALCRLATGGGMRTRRLYTDTEETILQAQRPIILNGIDQLATRPDLLDRAIVISLPTLQDHRDEQEFWSTFAVQRAKILGAILDAVALAMAELPNVFLDPKPRMADFALWGTALEKALVWQPGSFMGAYRQNREGANDNVLEASPVGTALEKLMAEKGVFRGTMTDLLKELASHVEDSVKNDRSWPRNAQILRNQLNRLAPNLRMAAIFITFTKDSTRKRNRIVEIKRTPSVPSEATEPKQAQPPGTRTLADGAGSDADSAAHPPSNGNSLALKQGDASDDADGSLGIFTPPDSNTKPLVGEL